MSGSILLGSVVGSGLELSDLDRDRDGIAARAKATLNDSGLSASRYVVLESYRGDPIRLAELFEEMAREWRGWHEAKTWQALNYDGPFSLAFTHDQLGHITMAVELGSPYGPSAWKVEARITIEAGDLERLARQVRAFLLGA